MKIQYLLLVLLGLSFSIFAEEKKAEFKNWRKIEQPLNNVNGAEICKKAFPNATGNWKCKEGHWYNPFTWLRYISNTVCECEVIEPTEARKFMTSVPGQMDPAVAEEKCKKVCSELPVTAKATGNWSCPRTGLLKPWNYLKRCNCECEGNLPKKA